MDQESSKDYESELEKVTVTEDGEQITIDDLDAAVTVDPKVE